MGNNLKTYICVCVCVCVQWGDTGPKQGETSGLKCLLKSFNVNVLRQMIADKVSNITDKRYAIRDQLKHIFSCVNKSKGFL